MWNMEFWYLHVLLRSLLYLKSWLQFSSLGHRGFPTRNFIQLRMLKMCGQDSMPEVNVVFASRCRIKCVEVHFLYLFLICYYITTFHQFNSCFEPHGTHHGINDLIVYNYTEHCSIGFSFDTKITRKYIIKPFLNVVQGFVVSNVKTWFEHNTTWIVKRSIICS